MQFFNKDDVLNAFHYRVSTRSYDGDKKIPAEDFNYILELGRLSPSSVGSEPWQFLVLQNADLRQKVMVTFGYRDKEIKPKARKTFKQVVKFVE